jgi:hypothetical protein
MTLNQNITPFALAPAAGGCQNQILGAFQALYDINKTDYDCNDLLIFPDEAKQISDVKYGINYSQFASYEAFSKKISSLLDDYLPKVKKIPNVFITVYNHTESDTPSENADALCRSVKEYYAQHNLGPIFTVVLSSRFYEYQHADLVNIPKHLMTASDNLRLIGNHELHKKSLLTTGIIHSFNINSVRLNRLKLDHKLSELENDADLKDTVAKINDYKKKDKRVVFCLGGRVKGKEIQFSLEYAQKLFAEAEALTAQGFGVAFVNGPRTPSDVTDYLYEQAGKNPQIIFQNCKKIAQNDEDRKSENWLIYSGKNEENFKKMQKLGNIYQGLLGYPNTLVVHTMDTYASCETAGAGIPTAISRNGIYIDPVVRYDCIKLAKLLCPKYAIDFDDFVNRACTSKIEPKDLNLQPLQNPLQSLAKAVSKHLNVLAKQQKSSLISPLKTNKEQKSSLINQLKTKSADR